MRSPVAASLVRSPAPSCRQCSESESDHQAHHRYTSPLWETGIMTEAGDETIRLGDRYELGGLLGRGGMADVRIGRDLRLGRTVAVKQLRSDLAADDTFQARFRKEAQSTAALNHPSIVAVYDTGESIDKHGSHVPYIVMEYVEGQTLRDILRGA